MLSRSDDFLPAILRPTHQVSDKELREKYPAGSTRIAMEAAERQTGHIRRRIR